MSDSPHEPQEPRGGLRVLTRRRGSWDSLEVRDDDSVLLARYTAFDGHLEIEAHERSLEVAAALAPYLLGGDQPFGEISQRHVEAYDRLGAALQRAPFLWHRAMPLRGRLLFFYCPLARLALEIVDGAEGEDDAADAGLAREGIQLATVPLARLEADLTGVTSRINRLCVDRSKAVISPTPPAAPRTRLRRWMDRMMTP